MVLGDYPDSDSTPEVFEPSLPVRVDAIRHLVSLAHALRLDARNAPRDFVKDG
jgi:hypothetical protein